MLIPADDSAAGCMCVYLGVRVRRGGCWPGSNVHMEVDSHTRIPLFCLFFDSAPNRRAWLRGLLIKRKITLILCMWQVAIVFICVCLDVQVHRSGYRPGSNVHTEVESHTRNQLFMCVFLKLGTQSACLVAWFAH